MITGADRVDALLHPRNIVVFGASPRPGTWGGLVVDNLRASGFTGGIYAVNPKYEEVWGLPCHPDLASLPEAPDQLAIVVGADQTIAAIDQGREAGARSAVVFAAGFGEDGSDEGTSRRSALASRTEIAICGPNCMGYASFADGAVAVAMRGAPRPSGPFAAVVGQSGGIGFMITRGLIERGVGVTYVVSTGNELGLTIEDHLEYSVADDSVGVVAAFIETVKDPDRFVDAARALAMAGKPLVAFKLGRSEQARTAAITHTGRLAGSSRVFEGFARDAGVLVVDSVDDVIETVAMFRSRRLPRSNRAAGITVSGGLKGMLLDLGDRHDVRFEPLAPSTTAEVEGRLGPGTAVGNPLDVGFTGLTDPDAFVQCIESVVNDDNVDSVLVHGNFPTAPENDTMRAVREGAATVAAAHPEKLIAFVGLCSAPWSDYSRARVAEVPDLAFVSAPDRAMAALSHLVAMADWRRRSARRSPAKAHVEVESTVARPGSVPAGGGVLHEFDSKRLLAANGLVVPTGSVVTSEEEAIGAAASTLAFPLVVKAVSADVVHKSDLGLVFTGLASAEELAAACRKLFGLIREHGVDAEGILVEEQVGPGLDCVVGVVDDVEMGHALMFGAGGVAIELQDDVAFGPLPATPDDALELVARTSIGRLVCGARGGAYDAESLLATLVDIAQLARGARHWLHSLDVNPLRVLADGNGVSALDATIVVGPQR